MPRWTRAVAAASIFLVVLGVASSAFAATVPVENGVAKPYAFMSSRACDCHAELVSQWRGSLHAKALGDPLYRAKLDQANAETGGAVGPYCETCHGPVATMTGQIGKAMGTPSAESVTCTFCHQATGTKGELSNTAHMVDLSSTRRGQIRDPKAPHRAAFSTFHTGAEICGACHNVDHPVNGLHLEATYREWAAGPYAKDGVVCQDCHMGAKPGTPGGSSGQAAPGAPTRPEIMRMSFVGPNVAQGDPKGAAALLRSAAAISLAVPDVVAPGEAASVTVTVTNRGAGHYIPTGLTEVREMWLSVFAEGPDGGRTLIGERRFGTALRDAAGKHPVEVWSATAFHTDDRIAPKQSVSGSYAFNMPDGPATAKVTAALYYRSVPDALAREATMANPVTTMAQATKLVFPTQQAKQAAAKSSGSEAGPAPAGMGPVALYAALGVVLVVVAGGVWWFRRIQSQRADD